MLLIYVSIYPVNLVIYLSLNSCIILLIFNVFQEQSKPFTDEQERIRVESKAEWIAELTKRDKKFAEKSTTLVDTLSHLRITEDWDVIK